MFLVLRMLQLFASVIAGVYLLRSLMYPREVGQYMLDVPFRVTYELFPSQMQVYPNLPPYASQMSSKDHAARRTEKMPFGENRLRNRTTNLVAAGSEEV
jgi:hypothetical protein